MERREVDCVELGSEATIVLEYEHILDSSGSLLGKVLTRFDCEHKQKCGVEEAIGDGIHHDWGSCAFHNAFTNRTS